MEREAQVDRPRIHPVESPPRRHYLSEYRRSGNAAFMGGAAVALSADLRDRLRTRRKTSEDAGSARSRNARHYARDGVLLAGEHRLPARVRAASGSVRVHRARASRRAGANAAVAGAPHRVLPLDVTRWSPRWRIHRARGAGAVRLHARLPDDARDRVLLPPGNPHGRA